MPLDDDESDDQLMARVQRRDEEAFRRLVTRHLGPIHSYVYRMCQNPSDADDMAQETFLRVWHKASTWRPGRVRFTTWLHRIARNQCIDSFRRKRATYVDAADLDDLAAEQGNGEPHRVGDEGADAVERSATERAVRRAVGKLPERQRTALALCHFQGWSNADAAAVLDVSVDALESLLARARRRLKSDLAALREET